MTSEEVLDIIIEEFTDYMIPAQLVDDFIKRCKAVAHRIGDKP